MSTIVSLATKLVACSSVALGITSSPFIFASSEKEISKYKKSTPVNEVKKLRTVVLGSTSKGNTFSLNNLEKINQLIEGKKDKLAFEEAGVKFGNILLSKNDVLISPCGDSTYYLLQSAGRGHYKLENGKPSGPLRCHRENTPAPYENLSNVKLNWTTTKWSSIPLPIIHLDMCFFKKDKDSGIKIICNESDGPARKIVGTFGEESFKYEQ